MPEHFHFRKYTLNEIEMLLELIWINDTFWPNHVEEKLIFCNFAEEKLKSYLLCDKRN